MKAALRIWNPSSNSLKRISFPGGSDHKEFAYNAGDLGSISGSGRSPGVGMETHSSILAWRISWSEEPGGLQSMGLWGYKESDMTARLTLSFFHSLRNAKVPIPLATPKPSDSLSPMSKWLPWSPWKSGNSPLLSLMMSSTSQPPVLLQRLWLPPWPRQARRVQTGKEGSLPACHLLCSRRCGLALCVSLIPCIAESGKSLLALLWLYNYLSSALNMKGVKWIITLALKWVNETVPGKPGRMVIPSVTE